MKDIVFTVSVLGFIGVIIVGFTLPSIGDSAVGGTMLGIVGAACVFAGVGSFFVGGGSKSSDSSVSSAAPSSLTERIRRAGVDAVQVTTDGKIYHVSASGSVGNVSSSGDVYMNIGGHVGQVRSDGVVVRDGIGPVLKISPDGSITQGGSTFATARPAMNLVNAGAGGLVLLIYAASTY